MSPVSICHSLLCCRPARVCSRVSKDYITQRSSLLCWSLASVCSRVSTDRIFLRHALQHCRLVAVCLLRRLDRSCFLMAISVMLQSSLHLPSSLSTASSPVSRPSFSQPFNRHTHYVNLAGTQNAGISTHLASFCSPFRKHGGPSRRLRSLSSLAAEASWR